MSKEIFVRLAVGDIIITKDEDERVPKYIEIRDNDGNFITEVEAYFVSYEDENGDEVDEEGNPI